MMTSEESSLFNNAVNKITNVYCSRRYRRLIHGMCDVFTTVMDKDELKARENFTSEQTQTHLQVPIYTGSFSEGLQNNNDMDVMYQYPYALDANIMSSDILKKNYTLIDDGSMVLVKKSVINYQYVTENVTTSTYLPIPKQTETSPTDLNAFVLMADDHMVVTKEVDIPCQSLTKDDHKQLVFQKSKSDKKPIVLTPKLFLVTEFSYPGHCFVYLETQTADRLVLYDIKQATHLKEQTDIPVPVTRVHDWPATKTTAEVCNNLTSKDTVICLKCPIWPEGANGFFTRHRKHDWPTSETLKAIKEKGLPHLVSKAHPYSHGAQADKEFRISTSLAGRMLVESMNDVQFKTYFLCKEIKPKEIEYQGRVYKNLITSYFIKTTIFWMCEEKEKTYWTQKNLVQIVADVYNNLITCLKNKSCPNYFIPENLMMSHFSEKEVEAGLSALENITKHKFFKLPESVFLNKLHSHPGILKKLDDMLSHEHVRYLERIVKTLNEEEDLWQTEQNKILKERIFLFIWYMPFSLLDVVCRRQLMQYLKDVTVFLHEGVNEDKVVVTIIQRLLNRMLGYAHLITAKSLSTSESKHHFQQAEDFLLNTKLPDILDEPEISEKGQLLLFYYLSGNREKCLHLCEHLQGTGIIDTIYSSLMIHVWLTSPNSEYLETTFSSDETLLKCLRSGNMYIFPTALLHYVSYCLDLNKDLSLNYLKKIVAELLNQYTSGYEDSHSRFYYSLVLKLRCRHNDFSESTRKNLDKMDRILKLIPDANKF
ncbi:uncharacterized protein LOC117106535 [Anneissia japonica]|uniref:uncharacterized protein LOC117106535 n=1 Tax=Anneissia japonica TaxID=1529436 RepID=UPI001425ABB3|nr:uncharacterized protein LOC117106535 [Anneissia japonica]